MAVVLIESDGSIRIAWNADGYEAIHVRARFRSREELADYARGIADEALFDRTLPGLRVALRARYPGAFDLVTHEPQGRPWSVIVDLPSAARDASTGPLVGIPDMQRPTLDGVGHAWTAQGLMAPVTWVSRPACRC